MAGTLETSTEQSVHHYSERCALYRTTEVFPLLFLKLSTWFFWNPCVIGIGMKNGNGVEGCHKQSLSRRISGKTPFEVESGKSAGRKMMIFPRKCGGVVMRGGLFENLEKM